MMYCGNCHSEIPVGKSYYRHQDTEESFCCLDCLTDWLIYSYWKTSLERVTEIGLLIEELRDIKLMNTSQGKYGRLLRKLRSECGK